MPNLSRPYQPRTGLDPVPAPILVPALGCRGRPGRLQASRLSVQATCRLVATCTCVEAVTFIRPAGVR